MLFCVPFSIIVSAGEVDNLIDSDLRNWDKLDSNTTVNWTKGYYQIGIPVEKLTDTSWCIGAIYDLSELNAGYSYKLNFYTVTPSEMGLTDARIYNQLNYGSINIGLGSYDSSTNNVYMVDDCFIAITKDNYARYFGYDTSFTFTLPNVENPCIVIFYAGSGNTVSTFFGFKNFSLIDTEAEKEQGFLDKLFTWFQGKFEDLGESFVNLGNDIKQGFTQLKEDLINGIKGLFVPDEEFMEDYATSWESLINLRFGAVAHVSGVLFDFFDSLLSYSGSEQNIISVPAVTLPLPDNASFTFGGFDVEIVNERFVFLQEALKILVGIVSTFAFIYGLRKRYDEVLGVNH